MMVTYYIASSKDGQTYFIDFRFRSIKFSIERTKKLMKTEKKSDDGSPMRLESRKRCPVCGEAMQMSGQKADSNSIVKQRYLCVRCKEAGRRPYNFFFVVE